MDMRKPKFTFHSTKKEEESKHPPVTHLVDETVLSENTCMFLRGECVGEHSKNETDKFCLKNF